MKGHSFLTIERPPFTIYKYQRLDSTNTYVKEHVSEIAEMSVIWAEQQTAGKGRFERRWSSAAGKDLTVTMLLPLEKLETDLRPNIPQICALAIAMLLEEYGLEARIKWPNDVLVQGKKICGILCEVVEQDGKPCAVLGVGLNVNRDSESLISIKQPATSMRIELGYSVSRENLLFSLLNSITAFYNKLCNSGFGPCHAAIAQRLAFVNDQTTVADGSQKYRGRILGLNPDGTLRFGCTDGSERTLYAGEVSFNTRRATCT